MRSPLPGIHAGARAFGYAYAGRELFFSILLQPAVFAFIVVNTAEHDRAAEPSLVRLAAGAALFSVWAMALGAAAGGLWGERRQGRLMMVASAPVSIISVLAGFVLACMTVALGALVVVLAVVSVMGHGGAVALLAQAPAAAAVLLHLATFATLAATIAPVFVTSEAALQAANPLLYVYTVASGFFTVGPALPAGPSWPAWPFPSYWASRALSEAIVADRPSSAWASVGVGIGLLVLLAGLCALLLRRFETAMRVHGTVVPL